MVLGLLLATTLVQPMAAPQPAPHIQHIAPGTRYDSRIPTLSEVVGHDFGAEITTPEQIQGYLEALARAAPDRTRLVEYARSWQGRPLHVLVVATPDRIARLVEIKAGLRAMADPRRLAPDDEARLVATLPTVTALLHGVHGNEISSGGAAMALAYHLLAAQGDAEVDLILRESIVLIDPAQNPDGRARFVMQNALGRAATPDSEPLAAEHDEPWPGGRSNHYLFDLNRDWFAQAHPESRGRVALLLEWMPHTVVDLHEMGGESTYYFPPSAPPGNPHMTAAQGALLDTFGRANADRFDQRGFPYFIREVFDSFYPGYGVSWPMMQGAVGMTFEKASARGLEYRRRDGTLLTYLDGITEHFTAGLTTAATAARHRERLLREFVEFRRSAVRQGQAGPRAYLLPPGHDPSLALRLARLLVANGVEVRRAEEAVRVGDRTLPEGTFVVPLDQPAGRVVRNLLDRHTGMDEGFLKLQDERRARRLPDQIYDVTAWSLPLLYDVECVPAAQPVTAKTAPFTGDAPRAAPRTDARVGYLLPWTSAAAATVAALLEAGASVRVSGGAFALDGRAFATGTALVRVSDNGADIGERLAAVAARHGAEVVPIDSAYVERGVSLGSNQVRALRAPRTLLVWDAPTQSLSAGWARYVLERRYGLGATAVRAQSLARVDLARFDVVVLPSGNYGGAIGEDLVRRLKDWVRAGGTLVTLAEASRWAARERVGLLDTRTEWRDGSPEGDEPPKPRTDRKPPADLDEAITPPYERPEAVPGAILTVSTDTEHWLAAGTDGTIQVMVDSQRVFTPITLDKGRNVGVYASREALLASGILWPESAAQWAQKAYLVHQPLGEGHVIAFAEDPNARAFAETSQLLFANAVLLGPAW